MMEGPAIEALTRRLTECPPEFLAEPKLARRQGGVSVAAVVSDLLEDLGAPEPLAEEGAPWDEPRVPQRNLMRLTLVACWLCHDDGFTQAKKHADPIRRWLSTALGPLAELVAADLFVTDHDRREELARGLLAGLGMVPRGETPEQAEDRLKSLGSVERANVIRAMRAKEESARKLREKMESEAAQRAAARYSSE